MEERKNYFQRLWISYNNTTEVHANNAFMEEPPNHVNAFILTSPIFGKAFKNDTILVSRKGSAYILN